MQYEVNVSKDGLNLFRTEISCYLPDVLLEIVRGIEKGFPTEYGFKVTVMEWTDPKGHEVYVAKNRHTKNRTEIFHSCVRS